MRRLNVGILWQSSLKPMAKFFITHRHQHKHLDTTNNFRQISIHYQDLSGKPLDTTRKC